MRRTPLLLVALLMLTACAKAPTPAAAPAKRQDWAAGTPEHAAQAFYAEYLQQPRLGDRTYRQLKYLSPELIQQVDTLLADWDKNGTGGYDPFLCAQNGPQQVIADKAEINGTEATLAAYSGPWDGDTTWSKLTIQLRQRESNWQIQKITCPAR